MKHLVRADSDYLNRYLSPRVGETRVGQEIRLGDSDVEASLIKLQHRGVKFVILGIPEDIGPRANLGRGGANTGWDAFLNNFLNLQHNQFINSQQLLLLGHIDCDDLQQHSYTLSATDGDQLAELRELVTTLDIRVRSIIEVIIRCQLIPIVIGGGHNNALPILQGTSDALQQSIAAVNLDPHTDFRALEGRHSGNGFSYAADQKVLSHYFSLGTHQLKNAADNLQALKSHGFQFISIQEILHFRQISWSDAITKAIEYLKESGRPVGIELDLDSITYMPASAYTNAGFALSDALYYVHRVSVLEQSCYLHLAEGAPAQHPAGLAAGASDIGNALANLVCCFIQTKQSV